MNEIIKSKMEEILEVLGKFNKALMKFEISEDLKIYASVDKSILEEFQKEFENFELDFSEYEENGEWIEFDYLPLYDAPMIMNYDLIGLAYALEEKYDVEIPEMLTMLLEEM